MSGRQDNLPDTVAGCDLELLSIAEGLSRVTARSRRLMLARSDRLLDRRLLLGEVAKRRLPSAA